MGSKQYGNTSIIREFYSREGGVGNVRITDSSFVRCSPFIGISKTEKDKIIDILNDNKN